MSCHTVIVDGSAMIVCTRGPRKRCVVCRSEHHLTLCDYEVAPGRTCDTAACIYHAHHLEPDVDYCPRHAQLLRDQAVVAATLDNRL